MVFPLLATYGFLTFALFNMFVMSLRPVEGGVIDWDAPLGLEQYRAFVTDSHYWQILQQTFLTSALIVLVTIVLGYPVALYVARGRRFSLFLVALIISPLLIPSVIRVYSWVYILGNAGFVNETLQRLGLRDTPLQMVYAPQGVAIGLVHIFLPFMILSIVAALRNVDARLEEAARGLGASGWRAFRTVTLPLSIPGVVAGSLLVFTLSIGSYITPAALGSRDLNFFAETIYDTFVVGGNWALGSAMSFVLLVMAVIVLLVYYRLMERQLGATQ